MKVSPILTSFNAGELGPLLAGRTDLAKYPGSGKLVSNFIPRIQGPLQRRGGTRKVAEVKDSNTRTWAVRFEFSAGQAWVLEFGDMYVRFYSNHSQYLSGGVPMEVVSPYPASSLVNTDGTFALKFVQSADVIYIAHHSRLYQPRKLTRLADNNWQFSLYQPNLGPFLEMNSVQTTTLETSADTGSITIVASAPVFAATDVGRLVRVEVQDLSNILPWETNKSYTVGDHVRYDGKTYICSFTNTSGTSPPVHERGIAYDGKTGAGWQYQDPGYGIARITAYVSTTDVTATVIVDPLNGVIQMPTALQFNPSYRWQLGAWSDTTEWPSTVTFFRNRLVWAGKQRYWLSVPNDFANMIGDFFGQTTADAAIWEEVQAEDVNEIVWLSGGDRLMIGTPGGEFAAGELTTSQALGPANIKCERQSKYRCRAVQPVAIGASLLYAQRAGRKLMSMAYEIQRDRFVSTDKAVLADRMTRGGIVQLAHQGEPGSIVWTVLNTGALLAFAFDAEQQVEGWARMPIGGNGIVESIATIPAPDGTRDELWLIVRRTIGGHTRRFVEYMERPWEGPDNDGAGGDAQADAYYVDAGITATGSGLMTITGLGHLEGQTVKILADGGVHPDRVVDHGAVTLQDAANVVQVGLSAPARYVSNDIEAGGQSGTGQGKAGRIYRLGLRLVDTLGGKAGTYGGPLDDLETRTADDGMGDAPAVYTGDYDLTLSGDWDRQLRLEVRQDDPLPMTIAALMPRAHRNDL